MDRADISEDVSFLFFLLPLIISGIATLVASLSASAYNLDVYLEVTRNPFLFLASVIVVNAGTIFETYSNPLKDRRGKVLINAKRMQTLAMTILIVSAIAAWVSLGSDASFPVFIGAFLSARFPIIFALLLIFLSTVLTLPFKISKLDNTMIGNIVGVIVLLLSPISLFAGSKMNFPFPIIASFSVILIILGIGLFLNGSKESSLRESI